MRKYKEITNETIEAAEKEISELSAKAIGLRLKKAHDILYHILWHVLPIKNHSHLQIIAGISAILEGLITEGGPFYTENKHEEF